MLFRSLSPRVSSLLLSKYTIRSHARTIVTAASTAHKESMDDPVAFWKKEINRIDWFVPPPNIMELTELGTAKWFRGGKMNTCYNCLDRHIQNGKGSQTAMIYDSPVTNTVAKYTYQELYDQVIQLTAYMRAQGVGKGDRVVIYMPNIPQAAISMLACARIGAIHSVVFGGFAANELATRIKDCKPKMILAASCGVENKSILDYKALVDEALDICRPVHTVHSTVIYQRKEKPATLHAKVDISWEEALAVGNTLNTAANIACEPVDATDPLYILYTSGTTGAPKGIVRENGGYAITLSYALEHIYAMSAGDVYWAASDVGWVVGHSFGVYGPLLTGITTVLYEGKPIGTPDGGNYWRVVERHGINGMFTAPTAVRAIKRLDTKASFAHTFNTKSLKSLYLGGERCDQETLQWLEMALPHTIVRDHWWQTETGFPMTCNMLGLEGPLPVKYGSAYRPVPGYNLQILDVESKAILPRNTFGQIMIKLPLPPGVVGTLYNAPERFQTSYLSNIEGYYDTGDAGYQDDEGYVYIMSRTDDVFNVAGHRLSSGGMEEVIAHHVDVAEVAVIGIRDVLKGQVPLALVVLNPTLQSASSDIVINEIKSAIRNKIGAIASLKEVVIVDRLPKTRSGKVLRGTLRSIADGQEYKIPATIEDPTVLEEVSKIIHHFSSTPATTATASSK